MVFDNLTRIDHANIVKFHRYWVDPPKKDSQKTRVIKPLSISLLNLLVSFRLSSSLNI